MMKKLVVSCWLLVVSITAANAAPIISGGNSKAPIEINADSLEVIQPDKKAIFSGKVIAKQGNMTLRADRMTVYYSGADTNGKGINKIDVDGNVFMSTPSETAKGNSGNYDVVHDYVILNGNVVLTRNNNVLKGTRLDYDIKNGRSKLIGEVNSTADGAASGGRVQGLFVPEEKK